MTVVHPDCLAAARTQAGWAFERIYETLAPAVQGYLASQGADDPAGATQETFLRAFRSFSAFEGDEGGLRAWIFSIARHLMIDERRFSARRPRPAVLADDFERVSAGQSPEATTTDRVDVTRLLALISGEQREVVVLRFIVDLSLDEVATITGRSVTAVKALQHRGLDALRRQLREISEPAVSPSPVPSFLEV